MRYHNSSFFLLPCYHPDRPHPICTRGKPAQEPTWFENGPPLSYLPSPVPDSTRCWSSEVCQTYTGFCSGHYLQPQEAYLNLGQGIKEPPSLRMHKASTKSMTDEEILEIAKEVSLPVTDVNCNIWTPFSKIARKELKRRPGRARRRKRTGWQGVKTK